MNTPRSSTNITKIILHAILKTLAAQPYLSRGSLYKGVKGRLSEESLDYLDRKGGSEEFNRLFYYLVQRRLIRRISGRGKAATVTITDKGLGRLNTLRFEPLKNKGRWDGKWRIVTFDVPKDRSGIRAHLRRTLTELGFVRLAPNVWIHPLSCREQVEQIKDTYDAGDFMALLEVTDFDQHDRYFDVFQNTIL